MSGSDRVVSDCLRALALCLGDPKRYPNDHLRLVLADAKNVIVALHSETVNLKGQRDTLRDQLMHERGLSILDRWRRALGERVDARLARFRERRS